MAVFFGAGGSTAEGWESYVGIRTEGQRALGDDSWDVGHLLRRVRSQRTPFPGRFAAGLVVQLLELRCQTFATQAEGARALHPARPLSPSDLRVSAQGEVLLVPRPDAPHPGAPPPEESLAYAAPELLQGHPPSLLSEQYALGVLLHELSSGYHPHEARLDNPHTLFQAMRKGPPSPPEGVDTALARLILRALEPSPTRRFESPEAFLHALGQYLERQGGSPSSPELGAFVASLHPGPGQADRALGSSPALRPVQPTLFEPTEGPLPAPAPIPAVTAPAQVAPGVPAWEDTPDPDAPLHAGLLRAPSVSAPYLAQPEPTFATPHPSPPELLAEALAEPFSQAPPPRPAPPPASSPSSPKLASPEAPAPDAEENAEPVPAPAPEQEEEAPWVAQGRTLDASGALVDSGQAANVESLRDAPHGPAARDSRPRRQVSFEEIRAKAEVPFVPRSLTGAPLELARPARDTSTPGGTSEPPPPARPLPRGLRLFGFVVGAGALIAALWVGLPHLQSTVTRLVPKAQGPVMPLEIYSEPSGAQIRLGGVAVGTTPYVTDNVYPEGPVELELRLPGHRLYRGQIQGGGQAQKVEVQLEPR